MSSSGVFWRDF